MQADLDHIVLAVEDVEDSLSFYIEVLGLAPYRVTDWRNGRVIFPSVRLNPATIIDLFPPEFWASDEDDRDRRPNLLHFCICVAAEDWAGLLERLACAGVELEAGPMTLHGARGDAEAYYLRDPDGNQVEIRHYGEAREV